MTVSAAASASWSRIVLLLVVTGPAGDTNLLVDDDDLPGRAALDTALLDLVTTGQLRG
jgi:hypothetical protein